MFCCVIGLIKALTEVHFYMKQIALHKKKLRSTLLHANKTTKKNCIQFLYIDK